MPSEILIPESPVVEDHHNVGEANKSDNNPEYLRTHPDAITNPELAMHLAEAVKTLEESMRKLAEEALAYAKSYSPDKHLLENYMYDLRQAREKISVIESRVADTYDEIQALVHPKSSDQSTEEQPSGNDNYSRPNRAPAGELPKLGK